MKCDSFDELIEFVEENGYLPDSIYCDECGLVKISLDQSYEIESILYRMSKTITHPIMVDVCECKEDKK